MPDQTWLSKALQPIALIVAAAILAAGLVNAVDAFRAADRYVTVKGLAERDVAADTAIWPLGFAATGDTPEAVQAALARAELTVRRFLTDAGFDEAEIGKAPPKLTDLQTERYGQPVPGTDRYRGEVTLTLRSSRPDALRSAAARADELVSDGVLLSAQWGAPVQYLFTELNAVKPAMIAEATANARAAAQQFAQDSGARVGGIRRATQGYFSVTDRDSWTPEIKT
ncbi:MAG: SIMPL domain-containing protein, partial [Halieaceae bacterium]|nr:SIMPL domain-containing protein [Halieaceae bacterium]